MSIGQELVTVAEISQTGPGGGPPGPVWDGLRAHALSRVYDFSKYRILVFENASLQISDCLRILWCGFIAFCES